MSEQAALQDCLNEACTRTVAKSSAMCAISVLRTSACVTSISLVVVRLSVKSSAKRLSKDDRRARSMSAGGRAIVVASLSAT